MSNFTPEDIKKHFPSAIERTYTAGQIIIYHGDAPRHVMFIRRGTIKFYDTDSDGNEKIMHIGGKGSIFPLFYAFEDKESVDAFYATLTETEVLMVPLLEFQNRLQTDAAYAFRILRWYAEEMDHIIRRLKSMEKSSAKDKILQALYYLSEQHATNNHPNTQWYQLNFNLTQQTLADLTGLTRETVNVTLKDAGLAKLIRIRKHIFEISRDRIAEFLT